MEQSCLCGRQTKERRCRELDWQCDTVRTDSASLLYQPEVQSHAFGFHFVQVCGQKLDCGNHFCEKVTLASVM